MHVLLGFILLTTVISQAPSDWVERIAQAQMLYTEKEPTDSEMMASIGNGYLATVIGSPIIYLGGAYNGLNTASPSHRAIIPATNSFTVGGSTAYGSALDLERATYYRRSTLSGADIEQRWYAHRTRRSVLVHEIFVDNSHNSQDLTFKLLLNSNGTPDWDVTPLPNGDGYTQYYATIKTPEEPNGFVISISTVSSTVTALVVGAGQQQTFYLLTAIRTNLDSMDPKSDAVQDFQDARAHVGDLHNEHVATWLELWEARIQLTGDFRLAQVLNGSLYYHLSSIRQDWPYSLSPGSLSSNGYNGHVFWDAETWMYPTLLLTHPTIARDAMLGYRFNRTDGASAKAKSYNKGYQGYMFPWESAFTGQEVCPSWAPTGELEQHITGDIGFAIQQYWYTSFDRQWLQQQAYPVLVGIAQFWTSRVEYNSQADVYEINGVIPPDEFAVNVNNSVYTNVVAGIALNFAVEASKILGRSYPDAWAQIPPKLKIPIATDRNIHLEFDGYAGQPIKQADVILLGFPLMYPMSRQMRQNDLTYYHDKIAAGGPAMTWAMETIGWLELGQPDQALKSWNDSWANAKDPFMVWTETPTGGTVNFLTGQGGFLQAVAFGYGGVRIRPTEIEFNPQLPSPVTSMIFSKITYRGNELRLSYDKQTAQITKTNSAGDALVLVAGGETYQLTPDRTISTPVGLFSIHAQ